MGWIAEGGVEHEDIVTGKDTREGMTFGLNEYFDSYFTSDEVFKVEGSGTDKGRRGYSFRSAYVVFWKF